jgi:hypothetical protein
MKYVYIKTILLSIMMAFVTSNTNAQLNRITNGIHWYDTDGKRIDAHSGGMIKVGDTFYWFGEAYGNAKSHKTHDFKAIKCYSSKNLKDWKFENDVITKNTAGFEDCGHLERPKVIYNEKTSQFVLWAHWEVMVWGDIEHAAVAYCDKVNGDYKFINHFLPAGQLSKDCTLYKDDDGSAYFVFDIGSHANIKMAKLTDDYLAIDKVVNENMFNETHREAPAIFKRNGIYYCFTSGTTGSDTNPQRYSTANSIVGPWSDLQGIGNGDGFNTQTTFVLPVQGTKETTYIYMGDRWNDPGFADAKNIWLPVLWDGDVPSLEYYDSWWIDASTGKWTDSRAE